MAQYTVSSEQLQSTASTIKGSSGRIMDELEQIIRQVQATKDFWTGSASTTYEHLMAEWKSAADKVRTSLDETIEALNRAADDYATTEQNQVTRFGSGA